MSWLRAAFWRWLPLAALTTALCLLVYLAVQQMWRHAANDPQIQMARDVAARLERGEPVSAVVPADHVDARRSLAPFLIVFDDGGRVVASSGSVGDEPRSVPAGVLTFVREHGEERVTWQPELGVRIASVVVRHGGASPGFVLAGRSLLESEQRTSQFQQLVGLAWLATVIGLFVVAAVSEYALRAPRSAR
ncbi:MAG TPA: hypothetical protein VLT86_03390 [Vicinamibacterales bacterium]|nr:hypothetical protein [Vicinamibacterales bacterium]